MSKVTISLVFAFEVKFLLDWAENVCKVMISLVFAFKEMVYVR